jgi:hypothetical protein
VEEPEEREPSELVETASAVVGALAGTALTLLAGPFVGSAGGQAVARVLLRVGAEIEQRFLGPHQEKRIADAYEAAAAELGEQLEAGNSVRADGFFDSSDADHVSSAEELLEGTLRTAAEAWEGRKVPYIGRIFGRLSFDSSVSPAEAAFLLKLADRVTYEQLVLLAFWAAAEDPSSDRRQEVSRLAIDRAQSGGRATASVIAEMDDLASMSLIGVATNDEDALPPSAIFASTGGFGTTDLDTVRLTTIGQTLHRLMGLDGIPAPELSEVLRSIRGSTP